MRVLFVAGSTCTRALKEASALIDAGIDIHVLQERAADQRVYYQIRNQAFYRTKAGYKERLKLFEKFDIIHVHNLPDWPVWMAREVFPDKPIVYDCHDLQSIRDGVSTMDELRAMDAADAYIFPSKSYEFAIKTAKPKLTVYSYCLSKDIPDSIFPPIPAVVYEGGIVANDERFDSETATFPRHRDYEEIAREFLKEGIPLALYGVQDIFFNNYLHTGAMVFPPIPQEYLIPHLSRYSWGFLGGPIDCDQWHKAMPNKLFEYITAGIPVIVYKAKEAAEWVKQHDVGIVIEKISDIHNVTQEEYDRYTQRVHDLRHEITMETQAGTIIELYKRIKC